MIIGFTGTQSRMNEFQQKEYLKLLNEHKPNELHHGDCIGADNQAHFAFLYWHIENDTEARSIVIHGPTDAKKRAWTYLAQYYPEDLKTALANCKYKIVMRETMMYPYLERNRHIVDACDMMIACPKELEHTLRSGTWATIRYAWHSRRTIIVIPPLHSEVEK